MSSSGTSKACLWVMLWECRACSASRVCLSRDLSDSSPLAPFLSAHHHSLGSESSGSPAGGRAGPGEIHYIAPDLVL